jgi:hypothetical protein
MVFHRRGAEVSQRLAEKKERAKERARGKPLLFTFPLPLAFTLPFLRESLRDLCASAVRKVFKT